MTNLAQQIFDLANSFLSALPKGITSRKKEDLEFQIDHPKHGQVWISQQEYLDLRNLIQRVTALLWENWDEKSVGVHTEILLLNSLDANGLNPKSSFPSERRRR